MKEDILRQIGTIARAFDSIANIEFKDLNLNRGQYIVFARINEHPGIISDHLAEMLNVDRTTIARNIQKLVKNYLIEKSKDKSNKKILHLFLTAKGEELADFIERENAYSNQTVLQGLTAQEQAELARMLRVLETNAGKTWHFVKNGGKRNF